jgi:hypothetical protein
MKRLFVQGIVFLSLLLFAIPVLSLTIDDVGLKDLLKSQSTLDNYGYTTELTWVKTILGNDPTLTINKYDVTASDWENIGGYGPSVFALGLDGTPGYYFVKIGSNSGSDSSIFLFQNLSSYNYAVIDLVEMGFTGRNITNIGKISHIGEVPESGTIILLGIGLLGLVGYGRRMSRM